MTQSKITDSDIIHFLHENKDFFTRHPEQLELLEVSNRNGKVASLINHQVNVLKERNNQLKTKLSELINNAQENEKIMSQVFNLSLQLSQISHVANVTKHFARFVKHSFESDLFKIVLPKYDKLVNSQAVLCVENEEEFSLIFEDFIRNNAPICGRLKKQKLEYIFPKHADKIGSSILLPIGNNAEKGILVFASFEENKFNPDMSTDLLSRLTQILDKKFKNSFQINKEKKAQ
ncbi:MAG: DUF484 family protein [Marinicellaceae bacterium]